MATDDMQNLDDAIVGDIPLPNRVMAPVRWYGGKGNLAKHIVPLIPPSKVYVEPFAGAASVMWHIKPRPVEVLNDLDCELVNFYRVMANPGSFEQLRHRIIWTLYSVDEFRRALTTGKDAEPIDRAWAFYVRQNQGFSGKANTAGDWSRAFITSNGMADTTNKWLKRMTQLRHWYSRLTRCQIDNRDAIECIKYWDSPDTCFYVDPPYVADSRSAGSRDVYAVECDDDFHANLVQTLLGAKGQVLLSGYEHDIYAPLEQAGWSVKRISTACHAAGRVRGSKLLGAGAALEHASRTECIWSNCDRQRKLF